jgi:zeta-carotene desaturase
MSSASNNQTPTVAVIGGGLAGISAGSALADAGYHVELFERRPYLGGRASSYELPGTGEVVDNCQHVLLGCCTNLIDFYRRLGVENQIRWYDEITFLMPDGRASTLKPSWLPAPMHTGISFLASPVLDLQDKLAISRALLAMMPALPTDKPCKDRFWAPVLISALMTNSIRFQLPLPCSVIRSEVGGSGAHGTSGYRFAAGAATSYIEARGGKVICERPLIRYVQTTVAFKSLCGCEDDFAILCPPSTCGSIAKSLHLSTLCCWSGRLSGCSRSRRS